MESRIFILEGNIFSVVVEHPFWESLAEIAKQKNTTLCRLAADIWRESQGSLDSAIRAYVLKYYWELAGFEPAPDLPLGRGKRSRRGPM